MALLEIKNLSMVFGGLRALKDVNLTLEEGEIVGLIGPNGAGKTTVFNVLTNVYQPTEGDILLEGKSIVGKKIYETTKIGIARTFQNIRLFKYLSAIDNVKIAMNNQMKYGILSAIFRAPAYWKEEEAVHARAMELLRDCGLEEYAQTRAASLPYGKQRKLEIARALATNPKVLLLDEPAAGMNPTETHELLETIKVIREKYHVTILLIEHDMSFVTGVCERLLVLDYGSVIASGTPEQVIHDPRVIAAYLGGE